MKKIFVRFPKHNTAPSSIKYTYVAVTNAGNVVVIAVIPACILDIHGAIPADVYSLLRRVSNESRTLLRIKYNIDAHYEFADSNNNTVKEVA